MPKYEFEPNAIFHHRDKADPQVVGVALEKIANKNGGRLKPDAVVNEASRRGHPLHRHFEWNDGAAATAYRLDQARALIRSVRIIAADEVNEEAARAYHSIQDDGRAYRSITEIQTSATLQLALHQAALRDLMAWESRYRSIADICPLVAVARERLAESVDALQPRRRSGDENRPQA